MGEFQYMVFFYLNTPYEIIHANIFEEEHRIPYENYPGIIIRLR